MAVLSQIWAAIDWPTVRIEAVLIAVGSAILVPIPVLALRRRKAGKK